MRMGECGIYYKSHNTAQYKNTTHRLEIAHRRKEKKRNHKQRIHCTHKKIICKKSTQNKIIDHTHTHTRKEKNTIAAIANRMRADVRP
jgi:hypothetical protein